MKMIKILGIILSMAVMSMAVTAQADYTIELKNDAGIVIQSYNITINQVAHLQKKAVRSGVSVIKQFENAIIGLIFNAKTENKTYWRRANEAYIEEQSRQ